MDSAGGSILPLSADDAGFCEPGPCNLSSEIVAP
jgi:hypothetical protein